MVKTTLAVINKLGLHARAAARIVETASAFHSDIRLSVDNKTVDGKSIMSIMMLGATQNTEVWVSADGHDERAALDALNDLFEARFGEDE